MNWLQGAGKICRGICYFGIWVYFMVVAAYVYSFTNSGFLMGATIFIINLLFWHAMSYIQNKTDKLKEERMEAETEAMRKQNIADERAWDIAANNIRQVLDVEMARKPIYTFEALSFKMGYSNLIRAITRGERVWRI